MIEIVPKPLRIEQFQLLCRVAGQLAHPAIVEQEPPALIDDSHCRGAMIENFAKLAFLLWELSFALRERGDVVDPHDTLAANKTDSPPWYATCT